MKEVIILDGDYEEIENNYFQNNNKWQIERTILDSFSKKELRSFIQGVNENYLKEYGPYYYGISQKKNRLGYEKLQAIDKYFVETYAHYFKGGKELEMNKNFLEKLKKYYKEKYEITHSYKREKFDISTISICEVISGYISLPKSLKRNIRCPLHKDKTASFRIYSNTQSFYCFGCHKGGNIVNFVSEIENISPKEAFKKLAQIYSNNK